MCPMRNHTEPCRNSFDPPDPREDPKSRSLKGVPIKYPLVARVPNSGICVLDPPGGLGQAYKVWECRALYSYKSGCWHPQSRCLFAREVEGVDLGSTARKCAWSRTPWLTHGLLIRIYHQSCPTCPSHTP